MIKRNIIKIDEEKCDGCGNCILTCAEGALQIIDNKAKVIKDSFCDGLGACLKECPQDALTLEEKDVEDYDEEAVIAHLKDTNPEMLEKHLKPLAEHADELPKHHSHNIPACPSARMLQWDKREKTTGEKTEIFSELRQWPVQLHLVSPNAPYLQNADLMLVADCVPFAYANFHQDFLKDKVVAIGCPKLDDVDAYINKVTDILKTANIKSLKIVNMEVPCCYGMSYIAKEAIKNSGKNIPFENVVIGIKGDIK